MIFFKNMVLNSDVPDVCFILRYSCKKLALLPLSLGKENIRRMSCFKDKRVST